MSPIHWVGSNGPMPERIDAGEHQHVHAAAAVRFSGGTPANALAVGIDAVDVPRLAAVLERTPAMRERCFTAIELVDAARGGDEIGHLATCFAAKEAVAKALGCGLGPVGFHDIELHRSASGAPILVLNGPALTLAATAGIGSWLVSATHTDTVAQTVVIALDAADTRPRPRSGERQAALWRTGGLPGSLAVPKRGAPGALWRTGGLPGSLVVGSRRPRVASSGGWNRC